MTPSDEGDPTPPDAPLGVHGRPDRPTVEQPPARGESLTARRLHPASPLLDVVLGARQFLVPAVALIISTGRPFIVGPVILFIAAVLIVWRFLVWSRFTYRIEDGMLRIDEGVLRRDRREVPLTRIQQVDLRRKLRHRVLGVAVVRIDTAGGGGGAEVTLEAIADDEALVLRGLLLAHRPTAAASPTLVASSPAAHDRTAPSDGGPATGSSSSTTDGRGVGQAGGATDVGLAPELVVHLDTRLLAIAGITGAGLGAGLTLVGGAFALMSEVSQPAVDSAARRAGDLLQVAPVVLVVTIVVVAAWLAVAAATSIFRDHDYTLVRYGPDLHLRRGLLDQREVTLALHRVQVVRVSDNPIRRRLGMVSVQLQSAGSGSQAEGDVSRLTIPLLSTSDLDQVLDQVAPGAVPRPALVPAPAAARRRARVRRVALVTVVVAIGAVISASAWALVGFLLLVPAIWWGDIAYRALGHSLTPTHVTSRWGAVLRHTAVVPVAKNQSCRLASTPFQRRVGLATLHLDVAGRGAPVAILDGDAAVLDAVRDAVLVSPVAMLDERATRRRAMAGLGTAADVGDGQPAGERPRSALLPPA